jgi:hypothetical protein
MASPRALTQKYCGVLGVEAALGIQEAESVHAIAWLEFFDAIAYGRNGHRRPSSGKHVDRNPSAPYARFAHHNLGIL